MEELFKKYCEERDKGYNRLIDNIFLIANIFLLITITYMCIFFVSTKPLWLLFIFLVEYIVKKFWLDDIKTRNDRDKYYHDGGLFFISFSQYIEEENKKCKE